MTGHVGGVNLVNGFGREVLDGFRQGGPSAPSERWVNLSSSQSRRGLPPILKSYTLCTAALRSNVDRGQHGGWVGLYQVNIEVQPGLGRQVGSLARGVCVSMMTHPMRVDDGVTVGFVGC
jgi:hypothetical protein